jgi:hypothetical protein
MNYLEEAPTAADQLMATAFKQQRETRKLLNSRAFKSAKLFLAFSFVFAVFVAWLVFSHARTGDLDISDGLLVFAYGFNIYASLVRYRSARAALLSPPDAA